jgi:hypothetical protein
MQDVMRTARVSMFPTVIHLTRSNLSTRTIKPQAARLQRNAAPPRQIPAMPPVLPQKPPRPARAALPARLGPMMAVPRNPNVLSVR